MKFIFLSIKSDARNYVEQKLKSLMEYSETERRLMAASSSNVQNALSHLQNKSPRIASEEEFFKVTAQQEKLIGIAQRCAYQELAETSPLLEGEHIENDFFSYLAEPFENIPAYTAVLRRTTNMSVMLYIFELVQIDAGKLVHLTPPAAHVPQIRTGMLGGGIEITGELIKKLLKAAGKSVASAGLSKLGAFVVGIVMKELFGDDTQRMLDEIKTIIKAEIESNEIAKVEGAINGTLQFLATEYKNLRAKADLNDVKSREKLLAKLDHFSSDFYWVMGMLKSEKYAIRGLRTYMMTAPVHMVLTQEMAIVDPDTMDPNKSGYAQTLRDNATYYRKHVDSSFRRALSDRNSKMEVYNKPFVDCINTTCVHKDMVMWRDTATGEEAGEFMATKDPKKTAWENASASLEIHRAAAIKKLTDELGRPQETFLDNIGALENFTFPSAARSGLKVAKKAVLKKV